MPVAHGPSIKDIEREERRARKNPFNWLRELAVIIICALVISSLLRAFLVQVFWIFECQYRGHRRRHDSSRAKLAKSPLRAHTSGLSGCSLEP